MYWQLRRMFLSLRTSFNNKQATGGGYKRDEKNSLYEFIYDYNFGETCTMSIRTAILNTRVFTYLHSDLCNIYSQNLRNENTVLRISRLWIQEYTRKHQIRKGESRKF